MGGLNFTVINSAVLLSKETAPEIWMEECRIRRGEKWVLAVGIVNQETNARSWPLLVYLVVLRRGCAPGIRGTIQNATTLAQDGKSPRCRLKERCSNIFMKFSQLWINCFGTEKVRIECHDLFFLISTCL